MADFAPTLQQQAIYAWFAKDLAGLIAALAKLGGDLDTHIDVDGNLVVSARAGTGKCLGVGTPVMLSDGHIRPVELIAEGDYLMGPDGTPRRVLSTTRGRAPLFRITPTKGEPWVCNEDHILVLSGSNHHIGEEKEISVRELLAQDDPDRDWKLVRTGVNFPPNGAAERFVDPYLLGLWLGDGTTGEAHITTNDTEVIQFCRLAAPRYGLELVERRDVGCWTLRFRVGPRGVGHPGTPHILRRFFKSCADDGGKRIPHHYITDLRDVRLRLLAGLIDSDGSYDDRCCLFEISVRTDGLAADVLFLARSLGFAAYDSPGEKVAQTGLGGIYHRITISGDISIVPTLIARKHARERQQVKRVLVTGFDIQPISEGDYYGFSLEGDGRFLLGDFTITHNTTTIIHAIDLAPEASILICAFNADIAKELKARCRNPRAEAKTLHGTGFSLVRAFLGGVRVDEAGNRKRYLTDAALSHLWATDRIRLPVDIIKLVTKLTYKAREIVPLATDPGSLLDIAYDFECEPEPKWQRAGYTVDIVERAALFAMKVAAEDTDGITRTGIDYADMIYLPVRQHWMAPLYEMVVVDEAQDMSASQLLLGQGVLSKDGRMVIVGDPFQAIYGFRGADSNSIDRLRAELNATELKMTTSWRCGRAIGGFAACLVKDFTTGTDFEGTITTVYGTQPVVAMAEYGDFILSRKNAPIASLAMALLRANKRAYIRGKEFGQSLIDLVAKLADRSNSIPDFLARLSTWAEKEVDRAIAAKKEGRVEQILDKAETLTALSEGVVGLKELQERIHTLFADDQKGDAGRITLSSIHKAKGLEANRVFILADTLFPKFKGMTPQREQEERNLAYVSFTRARRELVLVYTTLNANQATQTMQAVRTSQDPHDVLPSGEQQGRPAHEVQDLRVDTIRAEDDRDTGMPNMPTRETGR